MTTPIIVPAGALLLLCFISPATAATHCDLKLHVSTSDGKPAANLEVTVSWHNGQEKAIGRIAADGAVPFCDLPARIVDVSVNGPCDEVIVRRQPLRWLEEVEIYLTYPSCDRYHWVWDNGCRLMLRVARLGQPVEGVSITDSDAVIDSSSGPNSSDKYGRIYKTLRFNSIFDVELTKVGFKPLRVVQNCTSFQFHQQAVELVPISKN